MKKKRGHATKKADAAEQPSAAEKPAANRASGSPYPDEIKQAALAEYKTLLANGTKHGARKAIKEKFNLGSGVIDYWYKRDQSKDLNSRRKKTGVDAAAPPIDIKGAIIFLRQAADYFRHKHPVELNDQELMILHALRALTGKARI